MQNNYVSTTEAAKILGVSRITVFNKIKEGKIKASKVGRNFVIQKRHVLEAAGLLLTKKQKRTIDKAVRRATGQYEATFKRLGRE